MKDKNIVEALNRALSEYFSVPCKFQSFSAEVPVDLFDCGVIQGRYCSEVVFFSRHSLSLKEERTDASYLSSGRTVAGFNGKSMSEYVVLLCRSSKLRREILKVMLEHNG